MSATPEVSRRIEVDLETGLATEVRVVRDRRGGATAWVVAGLVAVVAIVAVVFMTHGPSTPASDDQIAAAADQGRAQGMVEGAQSAVTAAQINSQTTNAAQAQANETTLQARQAAADAQASAETARAASANATDAADRATVPASQPADVSPAPN